MSFQVLIRDANNDDFSSILFTESKVLVGTYPVIDLKKIEHFYFHIAKSAPAEKYYNIIYPTTQELSL